MNPGLYPTELPRPGDSVAEEKVYRALKASLPAGWFAWHSLRIRSAKGFLGEGDFVLVHPARGLLVLEVKGGQIAQRDGRWLQNGRAMERAPLEQAHRFRSELLARLEKRGCAPPAHGSAVLFPDVDFEVGPTQDDLRGVVLGARELSWLGEALTQVLERALPVVKPSRGPWVKALHELWGETWIPRLSLGNRVRDQQERRYKLDEGQLAILEGMLENHRVVLHGPAGSGKTLLAAEAARRHRDQGRRVLLLCFTRTLATWLRAQLAGPNLDVMTVSALAHDLVRGAGQPVDFKPGPEFWEDLKLRAADLLPQDRWDCLVVDEAQDLTEEEWLLVEGLSAGKRLWALYDEGQRFWPERVLPTRLFTTTFRLPRGYRCPRSVQALANQYVGAAADPVAVEAGFCEGSLRLVECPEGLSLADAVGAEIARARREGVPEANIAVVSLRGQTSPEAVFQGRTIGEHAFVRADDPAMPERLVADSFLRWKGLERPVAVLADVPGPEVGQRQVRMYVALTRALVAASVVATAAQLESDPVLEGLRRFAVPPGA